LATKKDKILETALDLFTKKGFNATTTKEIALTSGVAEGLIFYYLKIKRIFSINSFENFLLFALSKKK